jgi:GR25 family glycosyltransferase involved in LPS biosynthesis
MNHIYWGIEGWFTSEQLSLYELMVDSAKNNSHFVEVGAWKGRSTTAMAVLLKNSGKKIKFDVIDTFCGSGEHHKDKSIVEGTLYNEYLKNIEPVEEYINTIVGDSSHLASLYADNTLDFVFLDGDHSYEGITKDIQAWLPKLKPGGILAGDDFSTHFPDVIHSVIQNLSDVSVSGFVWIYNKPKAGLEVTIKGDNQFRPNYTFDTAVEKAYIISLKNEEGSSKEQTRRCIDSCVAVDMNYEIFDAFDGTDNLNIKSPEYLKLKDYMSWIKITDTGLTAREVGCALSHIALWAHCITIDKPIVILEHDAIMLKKYTHIPGFNMVDYLGNNLIATGMRDQFELDSVSDIPQRLKNSSFLTCTEKLPMLSSTNENYFYMMGAHAYALDPLVAKKLFAKVMIDGMQNPNDTLVSVRDITLTCSGLYAMEGFEALNVSTIMPGLYNANEDMSNYRFRKETYIIPSLTKDLP